MLRREVTASSKLIFDAIAAAEIGRDMKRWVVRVGLCPAECLVMTECGVVGSRLESRRVADFLSMSSRENPPGVECGSMM